MAFTEKDLAQQIAMFADLEEAFQKLNREQQILIEKTNTSPEEMARELSSLSPFEQQLVEFAKQEASAGADVAQTQAATTSSRPSSASVRRRGIKL